MILSPSDFRAGMLAAAVALVGVGVTAQASDRGLAMTIAADRTASARPGRPVDRLPVRSIYQRLGFDGPLREPARAELGLAGMRAALDQLVRDTRAGDRVFIYYAGQGTGHRDRAQHCEPALRAQDGRAMQASEFARSVQALSRKAGQLVMVVDAPFVAAASGSLEDLRAAHSGIRLSGGRAGLCARPGDWLAAFGPAGRSGAVVIAGVAKGGALTAALHGCLAQPAFAANPLASFADLQGCVGQAATRRGVPRPVWAGNLELPVQPQRVALVDPSANVAAETPAAALQRAAAAADAQWHVSVVPGPTGASDGPQALALSVTSDRDGFLYIVRTEAQSDGLNLVYPEHADDPNALRAGQRFELRRPWRDAPPAGTDRLMVLVGERALRSGDLLVALGLERYAAAACLRNLGSDDCPSSAAGAGHPPAAWQFGATLLPPARRAGTER